MSVKSPSKHLSRDFLRELAENNYISPRGIEYCAEEVDQMRHEKESELAEFPPREIPSTWEIINMRFAEDIKKGGTFGYTRRASQNVKHRKKSSILLADICAEYTSCAIFKIQKFCKLTTGTRTRAASLF
jgi:hypothetical protein